MIALRAANHHSHAAQPQVHNMATMRFSTVVYALFAFTVSACVAETGQGSKLAGSQWRFVTIDDAAAVSDAAELSFEDNRLGANVGCNGMGGDWRVEGGRLIAGPLVATRKYCAGPVWTQEEAIGALLVAGPKLDLEQDRLTLTSKGHSAELQRMTAPPAD